MTALRDVARAQLRAVRPVNLADKYANPRALLRHHAANGELIRLAPGYYMAPPDDQPLTWRPTIETATAAIATTAYPGEEIVLMGLTAARIHGALPRAIGVGIVAVPRQHAPITLDDGGRVVFVARDTARLDAVRMPVETGRVLVTTVEQTVLDLARRPKLGGLEVEARAAIANLMPRVDTEHLLELADEHHFGRRAAALLKATR
ncbi:hypothetical protein GL325_08305 [Aeromicrobium sp. 636]|uniref:AbiEi antitoxin C-terminal domain-containing protein n=1 Tax=Aeromicrobium senzhongii TaxID=2663859 RepID=A0A8I0EU84_9ACTN|nr:MULTISPECIES: type IV toxin-antitoxin system AbiEi family antitoxin [Aeromicrobium]MBC9226320.1 hypothetical protein [Aeromicrobium senzhongii]MCQ3998425.1 hypothetical protein [Aeromicrobium sp. 636]